MKVPKLTQRFSTAYEMSLVCIGETDAMGYFSALDSENNVTSVHVEDVTGLYPMGYIEPETS